MVDREARNQAAQAIRHYVCGVITNREFESRYPSSKMDPVIRAMDDSLWATYEDISTHKLERKNAASREMKARIARWLLFLYSNNEYLWPHISEPAFRDLPPDSSIGIWIRRIFAYEERSAAFMKNGHYEVWPFLHREEYEQALKNPILLKGNIQQALGWTRHNGPLFVVAWASGSSAALACFVNLCVKILKQFFTEEVDARVLADDLVGSMVTNGDMTKHPIQDMAETFQLGPEHLIRLCDAVLRDEIKPQYLQSIGFCIVASDNFEYDTDTTEGNLVGETVLDWSAPIINYPLTKRNVEKFRQKLVTGEDPLICSDAS